MKLTHLELNCLCENLRQILPTTLPTVSKSWNKERKVLLLRGMLCINLSYVDINPRKAQRRKKVPKLSKLCIKILRA